MKVKTISVITPSFNQAPFLPECLATVASQTYKPLEHIVLDPGSTDGSREIAKKADGVTLIAEPDEGQSDAICKGFSMASGDVLAWLNSDDRYPNNSVFELVIDRFNQPDQPDVVYGKSQFMDEQSNFIKKAFVNSDAPNLLKTLHYQVGIIQPSVFIHRRVFEKIGGPSDIYNYTMDYEYWVRIAKNNFKWAYVDSLLSEHRWWPGMKTNGQRGPSLVEHLKTCWHHFGYVHSRWAQRYAEFLVNGTDGIINVNQDLQDSKERVDLVKAQILKNYNGGYESYKLLSEQRGQEPWKETYLEMTRLGVFDKPIAQPASNVGTLTNIKPRAMKISEAEGISWATWLSMNEQEGYFYRYVVEDGFDWIFSIKKIEEEFEHSSKLLKQFSQERKSDTCIIVGNGPSLLKTDLDLLDGQDVIICNLAYYNKQLLKYARYFTVVNRLLTEQVSYEINNLDNVIKIFPFWLSYCLNSSENTLFLNTNLKPEFSKDATKWISWRSTVSYFNMQLAYSLGYKKVLLIGFDHSYKQPSHVQEGDLIDQKEDDINHFDPNYFKGKKWQAADVDNMGAVYQLAKKAFEEDSREIVNCTVGGKLEVFRRGNLEDELRKSKKLSISQSVQLSVEPKEDKLLNESKQKLLQFKDKHKDERCVIIGNGPSLNNMDLSFLKNEICFGLNKIYLGFEKWKFTPSYYIAVNELVIEQSIKQIQDMPCTKFISNRGIPYLTPQEDIIFIKTNPEANKEFSTEPALGIHEGSTVTYVAMQLAYYMGFRDVILIGVDHHFVNFFDLSIPNKQVLSQGKDLNHFHKDYFGKGMKWNLPDLARSEKYYKIANGYFWANNRQIFDATVNGKCPVFPKKNYQYLFTKKY